VPQPAYDVAGVRAHAAEHRGCDAGLARESDEAQAGQRTADATSVERPAVVAERGGRQVSEVGEVSGGEDDRVDLLAGSVGPQHPVGREGVEHRTPLGSPRGDRFGVCAVVEHTDRACRTAA
jgi:hypothetical protein